MTLAFLTRLIKGQALYEERTDEVREDVEKEEEGEEEREGGEKVQEERGALCSSVHGLHHHVHLHVC